MPAEHDLPPLASTEAERLDRRRQDAAITFEMTWLVPLNRVQFRGHPYGYLPARTEAARERDDESKTPDGDDGGDGGG